MSREGSNGKLPFGSLPRLQPKPVIIIRAVNRASALTWMFRRFQFASGNARAVARYRRAGR
jgi:hypothetical protein